MLDVKLRRLTDGSLTSVNIATLALTIRGTLHVPEGHPPMQANRGDAGPGLVVRCATRQDVIECLDFASRNGLLLTMHNRTATAWDGCHQGIAVDLSTLPAAEGGGVRAAPARPEAALEAG